MTDLREQVARGIARDVYRDQTLWVACLPEADAAIAAGAGAGWRPIETAPKDGTTVLLHRPNFAETVVSGTWARDCDWWDLGWVSLKSDYFDAWMPLPAAPTPPAAAEEG